MKAIFYIVAILAILGSSWFSYSSLSKIKKQRAFVQQQREELSEVNASIAQVDKDDSAAVDALDALKKERAEYEANAELVESKRRQKTQRISKIEERIADLDERLEDVNNLKAEGGDVDLEEIPNKIKEIRAEVEQGGVRASELEELIATAEKKTEDLKVEESRLNKSRKERANRIGTNSREAVVTAVNNRWGFAVLNLGKNQGFEPTSNLLVKRGSRLIGRLKVASIEPSQTIANFDRESITAGVRIRPGDRVIVEVPATK